MNGWFFLLCFVTVAIVGIAIVSVIVRCDDLEDRLEKLEGARNYDGAPRVLR